MLSYKLIYMQALSLLYCCSLASMQLGFLFRFCYLLEWPEKELTHLLIGRANLFSTSSCDMFTDLLKLYSGLVEKKLRPTDHSNEY